MPKPGARPHDLWWMATAWRPRSDSGDQAVDNREQGVLAELRFCVSEGVVKACDELGAEGLVGVVGRALRQ